MLLTLSNQTTKVYRAMDLIHINMKGNYCSEFDIKYCNFVLPSGIKAMINIGRCYDFENQEISYGFSPDYELDLYWDDFMERCAEIHEDEEAPEYMFQAWERRRSCVALGSGSLATKRRV